METEYSRQDRGTDEAYRRYLSGMDQSMRQKVALTAAHLLGEGTVADMGMGSGSGSYALASLYPRLHVVGVDVNQEMVDRAREQYRLGNLTFERGDVAERVFAEGALEGIFDSSVLHHVTSFSGYEYEAATRALANQVKELAWGGTIIVRDFVAPAAGAVWLDLPSCDGDESTTPRASSSACLLERFSNEFRPLAQVKGFALREVIPDGQGPRLEPGWRRYQLEHRHAAEFLLRKDYRDDWDSELLEEYCYFTQPRFEQIFAELGLRLLVSMPIWNPWIVKHRFLGKAKLWSTEGAPLEWPPTNYLIAAERVPPNQGVRFEMGASKSPIGFLEVRVFEHTRTGEIRDLVRRPGTTIDVIPWFEDQGTTFVLLRRSHPRPVLQATTADPSIDGAAAVGYVTEPILVVMSDKPLGTTVEEALEKAAGIEPDQIKSLSEAGRYYPSPGGLMEEVRAVEVEVVPCYAGKVEANETGFSTTGVVRAADAQQILRAAQVGALPDARLELNVYRLLLRLGKPLGPWIGAEIDLGSSDDSTECTVEGKARCASVEEPISLEILELPKRRLYRSTSLEKRSGFLELRCSEFREMGPSGDVLFSAAREYVAPAILSTNTVACALLMRRGKSVLIGLDLDDLPAVQAFTGQSSLWVAPAWRLPKGCHARREAISWVGERIRHAYGLEAESWSELGGRYHPSAGVTPEVVYPFAVKVRPTMGGSDAGKLRFVPLVDLVKRIDETQDGHLRIVALRAAHAVGVV